MVRARLIPACPTRWLGLLLAVAVRPSLGAQVRRAPGLRGPHGCSGETAGEQTGPACATNQPESTFVRLGVGTLTRVNRVLKVHVPHACAKAMTRRCYCTHYAGHLYPV